MIVMRKMPKCDTKQHLVIEESCIIEEEQKRGLDEECDEIGNLKH